VKNTPLLAITAAGLLSLCFALPLLHAQQPGGASARPAQPPQQNPFLGKVVLLDVNYVFKNHERFKALMNQLKNDADAMDVQMKKEEAALKSKAMGLQTLKPGSQEYKNLEEQVTSERAQWTCKIQQQRREFLMREAKSYNETYKEIEDEVNYFCQTYGVVMVLRFMGDPVEADNPDSILQNINKPVVWYDKTLDITPYILKRFQGPVNTANKNNAVPNGGGGQQRAGVPSAPLKPR
jgi:Skp family chaperone for outer membrane proteins